MARRLGAWLRNGAAAGLALLAAACSQTPAPQSVAVPEAATEGLRGRYKIGDPYRINGVWYYPAENYSYAETGIASFYGGERTGIDFHGRLTANGEVYNMNALTAAHQTLPMPSLARVTNLENGRQLVLRVNDRGPFAQNRILDVSRRSAQLLGFEQRGTAQVRVEILAEESRALKMAMLNRSTVSDETVAAAPRGAIDSEALPLPSGARATAIAAPIPSPAASLPPPPAPPPGGRAASRTAPASFAAPSARVAALPPEAQSSAVPTLVQTTVRPTALWIQAGAFATPERAAALSAQLRRFGTPQISPVQVGGQRLYRVRLGPARDVTEADALLSRVAGAVPEARILVE